MRLWRNGASGEEDGSAVSEALSPPLAPPPFLGRGEVSSTIPMLMLMMVGSSLLLLLLHVLLSTMIADLFAADVVAAAEQPGKG